VLVELTDERQRYVLSVGLVEGLDALAGFTSIACQAPPFAFGLALLVPKAVDSERRRGVPCVGKEIRA
jgi:hypothetical protein